MDSLLNKASSYLSTLCSVKPNRRTGSPGNQQAVDFFAGIAHQLGYQLDLTPFPCLDYITRAARLSAGGVDFPVCISPYSLPCRVDAPLISAATRADLESLDCCGRVLLLHGELCAEQLMPKNFVFYNPDHHKELIALLERKAPAALVTATGKNPELVGALDPFPLFADGDFDIPSLYCTEETGRQLLDVTGEVRLEIDSERIPSTSSNVLARLHPRADKKVVLTAHIDAYEDTPGAQDNASGTVVLLLLAELLSDYPGPLGVEILAFNGEDHYSVGGQMDYLSRYGSKFPAILLAINLDDLGFLGVPSAFSFYNCPPDLEQKARQVFNRHPGMASGEAWYQGDHMVFVQQDVPAMAFASTAMVEFMRTLAHTSADTPDKVDVARLVEVARGLNEFIRIL